MAQRTRGRTGRTAWVGALAVLCGGLTGCFNTDKKPIAPPPQAKGYQTTTGVYDKNTGQLVKTNTGAPGGLTQSPQYPASTAGITATQGTYPPGYTPQGPRYDPLAQPNANAPSMVGTPTRQMSATQFNSQPGSGPLAPSVSPSGGAYPSQSPAYNQGSAAPNYGQPTGGTSYPGGTTTNYGSSRKDPPPPGLTDLPVPPAAPQSGIVPPVGPDRPTSTPLPTMAAPLPPGGNYPRQ